jgi:hypothetical protein
MARRRRTEPDVQQSIVDERRIEMRQAVAGAVVGVYLRTLLASPSAATVASGGERPQAVRAEAAAHLGGRVDKGPRGEARRVVETVVGLAMLDADMVGRWLDARAGRLERVGCAPGEAAAYFELERRTLASLYFLAREPAPSPTEMLRLALRYALDARREIEGGVSRFVINRTPRGWRITEYPSLAHRAVPLPPHAGVQLVDIPPHGPVLDAAFDGPPAIRSLLLAIERIFGGIPQPADTLEGAALPRFMYRIGEGPDRPDVHLWINDREVPVPRRRDVHRLLARLCADRGKRLAVRQLERDGTATNVSQAVRQIREALEGVLPGSGAWLESASGVGWARGRTPSRAARGKGEHW